MKVNYVTNFVPHSLFVSASKFPKTAIVDKTTNTTGDKCAIKSHIAVSLIL